MNICKKILLRQINGKIKFLNGINIFNKYDWRRDYNILYIGYNYGFINNYRKNKIKCKNCNYVLKKYIIDINDFKELKLENRFNSFRDHVCIKCNYL